MLYTHITMSKIITTAGVRLSFVNDRDLGYIQVHAEKFTAGYKYSK